MSKAAVRLLPSLLSSLVLALAACETIQPLLPPPPEELDLWRDAAAGVTQPALAELCTDFWQAELRHDPFQATYLGDPRWNGKVPDTSQEGRGAWEAKLRGFAERLRLIERGPLLGDDRLTAELLRAELENGITRSRLGLEVWVVDPIEGPHIRILTLAANRSITSIRKQIVALGIDLTRTPIHIGPTPRIERDALAEVLGVARSTLYEAMGKHARRSRSRVSASLRRGHQSDTSPSG